MIINGTSGNDKLFGTSKDDSLYGLLGDDELHGDGGNDLLEGGEGNDALDGGSNSFGKGGDTASYAKATDAVIVDLVAGTAIGGAGDDTLTNVENIIGSAFSDALIGDDFNANELYGGKGDDTLAGGDGDDILTGGLGNDFLDGGKGGGDIASYSDAAGAVTVNLVTGIATGGAGKDVLLNVESATGSSYADTITGDGGWNVLDGGAGNDSLNGAGGGDTLHGGSGDDSLSGGDSDDWLDGGDGNDVLNGGAGANDTADYSNATSGVNVNLLAGVATGGFGNDTLLSVENVNGSFGASNTLTGNAGSNQLTGGFDKDTLSGGAGDDTLWGNDGDDTLNGGAGADSMNGGWGNDSYVVDNVDDVITEFSFEGLDKVSSSVTYTLSAEVENLTLTGASATNGTGNGKANVIVGNSAANQLNGKAGNDTLDGGSGNNVLTGGTGSDIFKFTTTGHADKITDYNVADDTIQLENGVFTALTATGTLAAGRFVVGTQALDSNDFVIYNDVTGSLLYDADGNGAGAAVVIAGVSAGLAMTNADIVVI
ncbi:calcium-binding protein [Nitrosomonas sp.]|uniref:calcium-binding protein n=1 Tax=Nitrosomonas sp. TaxID=42353 RepID=UPI00261E6CCB|nr:calcium-binding protein [Nitrosomonas sp.]